MTYRIGPYRIEVSVRYMRTNRKRCPMVRLRYLLALASTLPLLTL